MPPNGSSGRRSIATPGRRRRGRDDMGRHRYIVSLNSFLIDLGQSVEFSPAVNDRCGVDLRDSLEYPLAEFRPGLNANVPQEGPRHFAEYGFDDIEPRSMLRRQYILEAIWACG